MEKSHAFNEKENAATKLLHGMEGCAIFYVDTAKNGFLLHVLIF